MAVVHLPPLLKKSPSAQADKGIPLLGPLLQPTMVSPSGSFRDLLCCLQPVKILKSLSEVWGFVGPTCPTWDNSRRTFLGSSGEASVLIQSESSDTGLGENLDGWL